MKVICDRAALVELFNVSISVIAQRTPKPILHCIKLTAESGRLTLSGTDLEIGLRVMTDRVEIEQDGEAVIPLKEINQICRESVDATLAIEVDDDKVILRGADSRYTIFGYPPEEFPEMADAKNLDPEYQIEAGHFHTLIDRTIFATARENSRYAINGVLLKRMGKKIELIATDGRRLAVARGTCTVTGDDDQETMTIIPTKTLNLLLKLTAEDPDRTVSVAQKDNQVLFILSNEQDPAEGHAVLVSNLVEGSFPPYEDVIPKDLDKKATFDIDVLASGVRRAALLTSDDSKGVMLAFEDDQLSIRSRAPELGEAEIEVAVEKFDGEGLTIGFNPAFITEALKRLDTKQIALELKSASKPGMIRSGDDFIYVIMPVSLS